MFTMFTSTLVNTVFVNKKATFVNIFVELDETVDNRSLLYMYAHSAVLTAIGDAATTTVNRLAQFSENIDKRGP